MENTQKLTTNMLRLSGDGQQLLLLITPIQEEVSIERLTTVFQLSDYTNLKLNVKGMKDAIEHFHRLKTESERGSELESVVIAERIDAELNIDFDPLKTIAKAKIISAYGGAAITLEQLQNEMNDLNICYGINTAAINLLIKKSQQAKAGSIYEITIAKGKPAVHGENAIFKRLVETPSERLLKPQKTDDGRVDMHNLGSLVTVKQGDQLMRKIPYSEGNSGSTVTGDVIEYTAGEDFTLEAGKNTEISSTDPDLLISTIAGVPKTLRNSMQVDDVLLIDNVDVSYGNVDYEGSLIVKGNVCDGMKIAATGDISISGFVDSAQIECGGDLIVGKGIIGHKTDTTSHIFSCDINCQGAVIANFSQYSKIQAGLSVNIDKQLLHCEVNSGGEIKVKNTTGNKGTILGGVLSSNDGVNTVTLGAASGSKTIIDLVGLYPKLMEDKKQLSASLIQYKEKKQHLIIAQKKIDLLPTSEKKQSLDARLMLTKEEIVKKIKAVETEQENNLSEIQHYFESTKVIIEKELLSGVSISIGRETFHSVRNYGPTKVNVKNHKLLVEPYLK